MKKLPHNGKNRFFFQGGDHLLCPDPPAEVPIAKNTTNISQIYHKYTTKVLQNVILYHKNVILYHKNVILYHKTECFTIKCNILPHSVIFFRNNLTTNCCIPLQNIVIYHKIMYYTMNSSISTTK